MPNFYHFKIVRCNSVVLVVGFVSCVDTSIVDRYLRFGRRRMAAKMNNQLTHFLIHNWRRFGNAFKRKIAGMTKDECEKLFS